MSKLLAAVLIGVTSASVTLDSLAQFGGGYPGGGARGGRNHGDGAAREQRPPV